MFYQWNRRKGWNAIDEEVEGWDNSIPTGTAWYAENDPCPEGWRVPTEDELRSLYRAGSEWVSKNGVNGRVFGTAPNQIFLPAVGFLSGRDGSLHTIGELGNYWSNAQGVVRENQSAHFLDFLSSGLHVIQDRRFHGRSIRCVSIE
jgi:uncharacterized protein (TIGR02145 family)